MDITSFILGVCSVVVMGSLIVTVVSLVKIKRKIREIERNAEGAEQHISALSREAFSELENNRRRFDEVYRSMDSRLDKIMSKIRTLEWDYNQRKGKLPSVLPDPVPLGPSDTPIYPGYDYDMIRCKDNTSNQ